MRRPNPFKFYKEKNDKKLLKVLHAFLVKNYPDNMHKTRIKGDQIVRDDATKGSYIVAEESFVREFEYWNKKYFIMKIWEPRDENKKIPRRK